MESAQPQPGGSYFRRALGVVLGASGAHFVLAHVFLVLFADAPGPWLGDGPRDAVTLIVAATTLTQLGLFYLRTQYASPAHLTVSIPAVLRITPIVAAAALIPLTFDTQLVSGGANAATPNIAPVVAATWSSGLLLAILARRTLHALAVRSSVPPAVGVVPPRPPSVAESLAGVLGGFALLATVVVVGAIASKPMMLEGLVWSYEVALPIFGLFAMVIVAAAAGSSLGQSPGRDAVSIAGRLDALGYNTRRGMAFPVVVTSFDEVGWLFSRLEALRLRLSREMTLYQEALDRTRDADAAKAQFLGAVSHELRTPLNSVVGFAQLLLEGRDDAELSESQAEDVRLIQAGGEQLLALITDILDISMIETGELGLQFAGEDLGVIADEVVRIHQPLVREREVELLCDLAGDLPPVHCDRRRVVQVLTNLISNAIKFTEHGTITCRASYDARQERVVIRVIDTGIGIPPKDLDAIFEAYRQAGSAKRRKGGTGLGLAIARSIAIHHGGSLICESALGEGSTFTLTLPLMPSPHRSSGLETPANEAEPMLGASPA